jgi:putative aldouronate transport system permease protein
LVSAMKYKRSIGENIFDSGNVLLLAVLSFLAVYPFIYTTVISFSTASAAMTPGLHLWPKEWSFLSYKMVFQNPDILTGYKNTLFRTIFGTISVLFMTAMVAYPLSRRELYGRKWFILGVLITMIFSGGVVPSYLLIKNLGLIDNRLVYILPGLISGFNVIIMKNFFQSIPESLGESARIDGASEFRILFQIYLPLSKPILATIGLWTAVAHWNAWFDALLYINSDSKQVMQIFLQRVVIANNTELIEKGLINPDIQQFTPETIKAATVIVTILPILILYPFLQKYFLKGIMLGGIKE